MSDVPGAEAMGDAYFGMYLLAMMQLFLAGVGPCWSRSTMEVLEIVVGGR